MKHATDEIQPALFRVLLPIAHRQFRSVLEGLLRNGNFRGAVCLV